MKIIILEGIATSGKTSVMKKLTEVLAQKGLYFTVIGEEETLMPILNNTDKQVSINFLKNVIDRALKEIKDVIVFDRLYFTHIFKTNSTLSDFKEIEDMLKDLSLLVLLKIDDTKIPERIEYARKHREERWNEFVSKKGSNEEIYQYYLNQQRILLDLLSETTLKNKVYDTTSLDFDSVVNDILESVI